MITTAIHVGVLAGFGAIQQNPFPRFYGILNGIAGELGLLPLFVKFAVQGKVFDTFNTVFRGISVFLRKGSSLHHHHPGNKN
jgi:hypothetical protein